MSAASRRRSGGGASRTKGVAGEREVAALWQAAGFDVRGLEGGGDHAVYCRDGRTIHGESKRHERPQVSAWIKQVVAETPPGVPWVLAWRRNRQPWYAIQPLAYVIEREARIAELEAMRGA